MKLILLFPSVDDDDDDDDSEVVDVVDSRGVAPHRIGLGSNFISLAQSARPNILGKDVATSSTTSSFKPAMSPPSFSSSPPPPHEMNK